MQISAWFLLGALAMASTVQASVLQVIPSTAEPVRHLRYHRRQSPQNEAGIANIHDPQKECDPPAPPGINQLRKQLPHVQKVANIVEGDDQAKKIWREIQDSGVVPDIQTRKGTQGNMGIDPSATKSYDVRQDPDCWWSATKCDKPKHKNIPADLTSCTEPDTWGLSFDDGPNCTHNGFYDFLQKNKLRASLMYIGTNVVSYPYQAQRGLADGHDICVHTWSHKYMTTLNNEQVFAELYYTIKAIKAIIGVTPRCWRPPFGDADDRVRAIAAGLGLRTIMWEADTDDWNIQPVGSEPTSKIDQNYQSIMGMAKQSKSPMVLTHEINALTMNEFQRQYPKIKKAYKNVVPLTACVGATHPYPEDITYPSFKELTSGNLDAKGLPDGKSMSINPSPNFTPTSLTKQGKYSYMNPSQKSEKGSNGSNSGNASGSNNPNSSQSDAGSSEAKNGSRAAPSNGAIAGAPVPMALGAVSTAAALYFMLALI